MKRDIATRLRVALILLKGEIGVPLIDRCLFRMLFSAGNVLRVWPQGLGMCQSFWLTTTSGIFTYICMTPNHNLCLQWTIEVDDKDLGFYFAQSEVLAATAVLRKEIRPIILLVFRLHLLVSLPSVGL
jgi:hypothetical protein